MRDDSVHIPLHRNRRTQHKITNVSDVSSAAPAATDPKKTDRPHGQPPQHQDAQPGLTEPMTPPPQDMMEHYRSAHRFEGRRVLVTGGDSGIGRAAAIGFAMEGADVAIAYLNEDEDALTTKRRIEDIGKDAVLFRGDVGDEQFCNTITEDLKERWGEVHVLCNNAAEQHVARALEDIDEAQLIDTFRTNIFAMFFLTKAVLPYMSEGAAIVNTASVTAYKGNPDLIDYSSTKGAIVAYTRSLALNLAKRGIRVNAVAPGPVWTPLIPASFPSDKVSQFGRDVPLERAGQPDEIAPAMIFLASSDASYITGQVLHVNGGTIVNG